MIRTAARVAPWAAVATFAWLWLQARRQSPPPPSPIAPEDIPELLNAVEPDRGRLARRPPQIPPKGWKDVLWRTLVGVFRNRVPATAAGVTFFALVAIFPAIGAFVSLYGLFADVGTVSRELEQLAAFVPIDALTLIAGQMVRLATTRPETLSLAFVTSLVLSIFTANAGTLSLFDGLNIVYEEREKRNFFTRRLVAYGFTFLSVVFLTLTVAILVAIPLLFEWLGFGESLLVPLRWLLLPLLAATAFIVLYRYGPSRERARWRWLWPGAVAAAVAWVAVSLVFSWYVNNVAHYDATYGPLGAVVAFMIWIWLTALVVLIGGELNAQIEHQTALDSTTGRPQPIGSRGAVMADTVGAARRRRGRIGGLAAALLQRLNATGAARWSRAGRRSDRDSPARPGKGRVSPQA